MTFSTKLFFPFVIVYPRLWDTVRMTETDSPEDRTLKYSVMIIRLMGRSFLRSGVVTDFEEGSEHVDLGDVV